MQQNMDNLSVVFSGADCYNKSQEMAGAAEYG